MKLKNSWEKESKLNAFHQTRKWKYFSNGVSINWSQIYYQNTTWINHRAYDVEFESLT